MLRYCPIGMFCYQISGSHERDLGLVYGYGYIGVLPKFMFMSGIGS